MIYFITVLNVQLRGNSPGSNNQGTTTRRTTTERVLLPAQGQNAPSVDIFKGVRRTLNRAKKPDKEPRSVVSFVGI